MRRQARAATGARSLAVLLGALLLLLFVAAPAHAAKGTVEIWGSTGSGKLSAPKGVAVNQSSGEVYVADSGHGRVVVFDASGAFSFTFGRDVNATNPGGGAEICTAASGDTCQMGQSGSSSGEFIASNFGGPTGIAIDQPTGAVYVGDPGNARVQKFDASGNFVLAFGDGVNQTTTGDICTAASGDVCQAGTNGEGNGQFPRDPGSFLASTALRLAVVPASGKVYVADIGQTYRDTGFALGPEFGASTGNRRVQVFEPSGQFSAAFEMPRGDFLGYGLAAGEPNPNAPQYYPAEEPFDIAAGPGEVLYTTQTSGVNTEGGTQVRAFSSGGASLGDFAPLGLPTFTYYDVGNLRRRGVSPVVVAADLADGHVYVGRLSRPVPEEGKAGDPGSTMEVAEFDAEGNLLDSHAIGMPWPNGVAVDSSSGRIYVSEETFGGEDRLLVIDDLATTPAATIAAASAVDSDSATLNGSVNPNGDPIPGLTPTGYHFEYRAEDSAEWISTPASDADAGTGSTPIAVSEAIEGLEPNTTYHARLVATRALGAGHSVSAETTFTTDAVPPLVTGRTALPVLDTSAILRGVIDPRNSATTYYFQYGLADCASSPCASVPVNQDGDGGAGSGEEPVYERVEALQPETTYHFRLVAENQAGTAISEDLMFTTLSTAAVAWPGRGIELVSTPSKGNSNPLGELTADGAKVIWFTNVGTPDTATAGGPLLAERTSSGWESTSLLPRNDQLIRGDLGYGLIATAPDFSAMLFAVGSNIDGKRYVRMTSPLGEKTLTLLAQGEQTFNIETTSFAVNDRLDLFLSTKERLVTGDVNGSHDVYAFATPAAELVSRLPSGAVCGVSSWGTPQERRWASTDINAPQRVFFSCNSNQKLYVRDLDADVSTLISGPAVSGSDQPAEFITANPQGTAALYLTETKLAAEDESSGADIYRWASGVGNECLTCSIPNSDVSVGSILVSGDMSTAYFVSQNTSYVLANGVSKTLPFRPSTSQSGPQLTPDGSVVAFDSSRPLTAEKTGHTRQVYRYDRVSESLECVSCRLDGDTSRVGVTADFHLTDDGQTIVFNTEEPLLSADINQGSDIYEWRNGRVRLVTDGATEWPPSAGGALNLIDVSPNGLNVLFSGAAKLTGYEEDNVAQLYVARLGGGFPPPPGPPARCVEDSCQGPLLEAPALADPGSSGLTGAGNLAPRPNARKRRCKRGQRKVRVRGKARCRRVAGQRRRGHRGR